MNNVEPLTQDPLWIRKLSHPVPIPFIGGDSDGERLDMMVLCQQILRKGQVYQLCTLRDEDENEEPIENFFYAWSELKPGTVLGTVLHGYSAERKGVSRDAQNSVEVSSYRPREGGERRETERLPTHRDT